MLDEISQQQGRITLTLDQLDNAVCSKLCEVQKGFQHIQNNLVIYEPTQRTARNVFNRFVNHEKACESTVYWHWKSLHLLLGFLHMDIRRFRKTYYVDHQVDRESMHSQISVTFTAPLWLSKLAISFMAKIDHDLTSREWILGTKLKPMIVNNDPLFHKAMENCDVESMRRSFEVGTARPSDFVMISDFIDPGPILWFQVSHGA